MNGLSQRCGVCDGHGYIQPISTFSFLKILYYVFGLLALCAVCRYFALPHLNTWWANRTGQNVQGNSGAVGDYGDDAPEPGEVDLRSLHRGECFDTGRVVIWVMRMSCADDHDGEVLGQVTGVNETADMDSVCARVYSTTVRQLMADGQLQTQNVWNPADHTTTCTAVRGNHTVPLSGHLP
jgi:hypothetical protein